MKKESRILLHVRAGGYDFIAVLRGVKGIEHLRILEIQDSIKDLAERISRESFFNEVKYVATYPKDLAPLWLGALRDLGRSDIKIATRIPREVEEILGSYVEALSKLAQELDRVKNQGVQRERLRKSN